MQGTAKTHVKVLQQRLKKSSYHIVEEKAILWTASQLKTKKQMVESKCNSSHFFDQKGKKKSREGSSGITISESEEINSKSAVAKLVSEIKCGVLMVRNSSRAF